MTKALCISCGSLKTGTLLACEQCGDGSTGNMDLDIAFTDHYLTETTLEQFGEIIQRLHNETNDAAVVFWAFMTYVFDRYPEIIWSTVPRKYRRASAALLNRVVLPEVTVQDSPRLDAVESSEPLAKYMSRIRHHQIECDSCGQPQSFAVWSRINEPTNPMIKSMVVSGCLFVTHCKKCGHRQPVVYDTLYLDIEKRLALWLRNSSCRRDFRLVIPPQEYFDEIGSDFLYRTVSSPLELAEKVRIFNDGHDDVLIEFIKLCISVQRGEGIQLVEPLYYVGTKKRLLRGDSMVFSHASEPEDIDYPFRSQRANVLQIMAKLRPFLAEVETDWSHVNRRFLVRILESAGLMIRLDV